MENACLEPDKDTLECIEWKFNKKCMDFRSRPCSYNINMRCLNPNTELKTCNHLLFPHKCTDINTGAVIFYRPPKESFFKKNKDSFIFLLISMASLLCVFIPFLVSTLTSPLGGL